MFGACGVPKINSPRPEVRMTNKCWLQFLFPNPSVSGFFSTVYLAKARPRKTTILNHVPTKQLNPLLQCRYVKSCTQNKVGRGTPHRTIHIHHQPALATPPLVNTTMQRIQIYSNLRIILTLVWSEGLKKRLRLQKI